MRNLFLNESTIEKLILNFVAFAIKTALEPDIINTLDPINIY